jgi:hypothetical protein
LCDYAHGEKRHVKSLKESELLAAGAVFSAEQYANKAEADLEDVIGNANFLSIVNEQKIALTGGGKGGGASMLSQVERARVRGGYLCNFLLTPRSLL